MNIDRDTTALIIVDLQNDFMPGGQLGVPQGHEIVPGIVELMPKFKTIIATQDWHPRGHISFANQQEEEPFTPGELYGQPVTWWPDHCVQGSHGAELHPMLPQGPLSLILRKGADPFIDSYSAFKENHGPDKQRLATGLMGFLFERRIRSVYVCGLARDYCVKWTAIDAGGNGAFKTYFLWDLTRPVSPNSDDLTLDGLQQAAVMVVRS